jgi:hypothetical protein
MALDSCAPSGHEALSLRQEYEKGEMSLQEFRSGSGKERINLP